MTAADDTPTATVTISRSSPDDVQERQVILSLDGEPLATLLYGQSATRTVAAGTHRLRAHNTLVWKTMDFEVGPGEHARFDVSNRPGFGTKTFITMLGVGPLYLGLVRRA